MCRTPVSATLLRERITVAAVFFVTGATFGTWAARIPAVQEATGLTAGQLGIAFAGHMAGALLGLPVAGAAVSRLGSRRLLLGGAGLFIPMLTVLPVVGGVTALTGALAAFGAGNSAVDVAINTQAAHIERRVGAAVLSGFHAMFSVGMLAAAGLGAVLAARDIAVTSHFTMVAAVLLTVAVSSVAGMTDEPRVSQGTPLLALPTRALAIPAAIAFAMVFAEDIVNTWSAVYLRTTAGTGADVAAAGFAIYATGTLAGRLIADRFVRRNGPAMTLHTGGAIATAGALLTVGAAQPLMANVGLFLLGLGLAPVLPVLYSVVAHRDAGRAGTAIAAVTTVGYLGSVAGPPLVGLLAEPFTLRAALSVLPVATVCAALLPRWFTGSVQRR